MANVITRALGAGGHPEVTTVELIPGDRVLLCTDGICGSLSDNQLEEWLLADTRDPAGALVEQALHAGPGFHEINVKNRGLVPVARHQVQGENAVIA